MPRRATSPGTRTQSPAFSLFPNTPRTRDTSPSSRSRPSGTLQRSNTSPAALSPSRPTFAPGLDNEDHASLVSADSPTVPRRQQPEIAQEPRKTRQKKDESKAVADALAVPSQKPQRWSQAHLALDSSSDNEGEGEKDDEFEPVAVAVPMKPKLPEPHWQMVNRSHAANDSVSGSSASGSDHSTSTSASSITTPLSASTAPYPVVKPLRVNSPPTTTRSRAPTVSQPLKPAMTRSRSATTVGAPSAIPRRNPSAALPNSSSSNLQVTSPKSDEDEARLETAADVSIARQISVSRQQRQLLVPIKTSIKAPSTGNLGKNHANGTSNGSPKKERGVGSHNFPTPASGFGAISVGKVSSPLSAIAIASKEERERGSPSADKSERSGREKEKDKSPTTERLVQVAKPSTPTLVVVGDSVGEREKAWAGATANLKQGQAPVGFSERRRQKESMGPHAHQSQNPTVGEIRVGLAVARESSPARRAKELSHRKSERVVVERVSSVAN